MTKTPGGALQGFLIGLGALTLLTLLGGGAIYLWNRTTQDFAAPPASYDPSRQVRGGTEVDVAAKIEGEFKAARSRHDRAYEHRLTEDEVSEELFRRFREATKGDDSIRIRNVQTRFADGRATIIAALDSRLPGLPPRLFVTVRATLWAEQGKIAARIDDLSLGTTKAPKVLVDQIVDRLMAGLEDQDAHPSSGEGFFIRLDDRFSNITSLKVTEGELVLKGTLPSKG